MASRRRSIRVFNASPNDLGPERRAFKATLDTLNGDFGLGANVEFVPLGWEALHAQVGQRNQDVINEQVDACDVFVLALWRRWGQEAPDAKPYSSYTEEEFHRALLLFAKERRPTIYVFFKEVAPREREDPGPHLKKVLEFQEKLQATKIVIYRTFKDEKAFSREIDAHLKGYVNAPITTTRETRSVPPVIPEPAQKYLNEKVEEAQRLLRDMQEIIGRLAETQDAQAATYEKLAEHLYEQNDLVGQASMLQFAQAQRADVPDWFLNELPHPFREAFARIARIKSSVKGLGQAVEGLYTFFYDGPVGEHSCIKLQVIKLAAAVSGRARIENFNCQSTGDANVPSRIYCCDSSGCVKESTKGESEVEMDIDGFTFLVVVSAYRPLVAKQVRDRWRDWIAVEVGSFSVMGYRKLEYLFGVCSDRHQISFSRGASFPPFTMRTTEPRTVGQLKQNVLECIRNVVETATKAEEFRPSVETLSQLRQFKSLEWRTDYREAEGDNVAYVIEGSPKQS